MKYFYALTDTFTGDYPKEATSGFGNTKEVLAFTTKQERTKWLAETLLLTAKALTRKEAIKYALKGNPVDYGLDRNYESVKVARIFRSTDFITSDGGIVWYQYTSLWYSAN